MKGPIPREKEEYAIVNPQIFDANGLRVSTEEISLVQSGAKVAATGPCILNERVGAETAIYEVHSHALFEKRIYPVRFAQVVMWSLFGAWLITWALSAEPLQTGNLKRHLLFAVLSAVAFSTSFTIFPTTAVPRDFSWIVYLPQGWRNCHFFMLSLVLPFYVLYRKADSILQGEDRSSLSAKLLAVLLSLFILIGLSYREVGSYPLMVCLPFVFIAIMGLIQENTKKNNG